MSSKHEKNSPPKNDSIKVEYWPIERVIAYARNSRLHSDGQIDAIAASIQEFGFVNPCLVDADGVLIAGHGRVLAMRKLERDKVPVIRLGHLSESQAKALRIADNQLPTLASWDADMLRLELNDLQLAGYNMPLLGFDDVQLVSFMANVPSGTDPEVAPEPPKIPVSRLGDVWQLGKHRLLCGDSTKEDDVARVLDGKKPNLMVTDPPYGVNYDPKWREEMGTDWMGQTQRKSTHSVKKEHKGRSLGKVENDDRADWLEAWDLFPGDVVYVWCASLFNDVVIASLESAGFQRRAQIIWNKQHFTFGRGDYHWRHEPCWYAVRKGKTSGWSGDRKQVTVWDIENASAFKGGKDDMVTGHGTQKPIECMRRPIQNNSKPGDFVYEPFSGSGTTIIAAEMMTRYCLAIELSPEYVDVAVMRWQEFAKADATLIGDGRTFAEVAKARKKPPGKKQGGSKKPVPSQAARSDQTAQ